jgi:ribosomal protein S18 acetylase RimI-like enzyme
MIWKTLDTKKVMEMNKNQEKVQARKRLDEYHIADKDIFEKYEFRSIRLEEADQAADIEQICFPPNEACSEQHMKERIAKAPELFLVAVDRSTGRLAGFLNGLATDEYIFRDEFFTDANLYNPAGKNIMLLGLDVLPEHRRQGLAKELVYSYARNERENGRHMLILTCLKSKVKMYEKMGFKDRGIANSTWGGEEWHEMTFLI